MFFSTWRDCERCRPQGLKNDKCAELCDHVAEILLKVTSLLIKLINRGQGLDMTFQKNPTIMIGAICG